jgi:parallel beta-helix repeat protein
MKKLMLLAAVAAGLMVFGAGPAGAATNCAFTTKGATMTLTASCNTDETIVIPNGMTLDGKNRTITATDPASGHFVGAVVRNGGAVANVKNLVIDGNFTVNACDAGNDRLRGIMFEGASGSITKNTVLGITQPSSGCQEGNAIEVRNAPFDGTHPNTQTVDVSKNTVADWQKTGILANGDVNVSMTDNSISASADGPSYLAANSIQLGFGAIGDIEHNTLEGNQWCGASDDVATGILLYDSGAATVSHNTITGNSDVGIYVGSDNAVVDHNKVTDEGADCNQHGYDIGIGNYGSDLPGDPTTNNVDHNTVSGFDTPFEGPVGSHNKVKPSA